MSYTYLSTAPNSSDRSWVRLRIGDTSSGNPSLQDEDIDALIASEGNRFHAAAAAAETIGARLATRVDKTVGRLRINHAQASEHYFKLAKRLRAEAGTRVGWYAGGVSQSDRDTVSEDTDRPARIAEIGMHDHPGVAAAESSS